MQNAKLNRVRAPNGIWAMNKRKTVLKGTTTVNFNGAKRNGAINVFHAIPRGEHFRNGNNSSSSGDDDADNSRCISSNSAPTRTCTKTWWKPTKYTLHRLYRFAARFGTSTANWKCSSILSWIRRGNSHSCHCVGILCMCKSIDNSNQPSTMSTLAPCYHSRSLVRPSFLPRALEQITRQDSGIVIDCLESN